MIFKRVNRDIPERLFLIGRASEALAKDNVVQWETASASIDGVRVRLPDTSHAGSIVGIVDAALADQAYGLIQVFGYRSTSNVFQTNTSQDTGAFMEASLGAASGAAQMSTYASSQTIASNTTVSITHRPGPYFVLGETVASSSASATISAKVFVRAM